MNKTNLEYICNKLLEISWMPSLSTSAMKLLDKCDSQLERMFLVGALYYLHQAAEKSSHMFADEFFKIDTHSIIFNSEKIKGLYIYEAWPLWYACSGTDCGPKSVLIVPQMSFATKYHHDFGLLYGTYGRPETFYLKYAVEIDGYQVHKSNRQNDAHRDSLVNYPVIRLQEELHSPLQWFQQIINRDENDFHEKVENGNI